MALASGLGGFDAGLERRHHVDDLRLLILHGRQLELFPGGLAADQVEDLDPVLVGVLVGVELGGQRPDQHLGHLHLAVSDGDVPEARQLLDLVDRDDLIVVDEREHDEAAALGLSAGLGGDGFDNFAVGVKRMATRLQEA